MKIKISEIADIFLGVSKYRLNIQEDGRFEYKLIESKDFDYEGIESYDNLTSLILDEEIPKNNTLKKGDVIIKLFTPYTISVVTNSHTSNCIVPSNVAIIRQEKYPPYYLREMILYVWHDFLNKVPRGSTLKTIGLSDIKNMEINVDSNENIINIKNELIQENLKLKNLLEKKEKLNTIKIKKLIGECNE